MGSFVLWDVLSFGTLCPLGRFVPRDVLSLGTYCPLGRFVRGIFNPTPSALVGLLGAAAAYVPWDVLS